MHRRVLQKDVILQGGSLLNTESSEYIRQEFVQWFTPPNKRGKKFTRSWSYQSA